MQTDARLDPLDLRGAFETLGIEVLDDSGGRLSGARVVLRMPGLAAPERAAFTADGRAEFFTQSGPHDIDVEMKGWRRAHLASVRGDQVVRLSKGMQVLVRVGGHAVRPPPPDHLAVGLVIGTRDHPILDGVATLSDPQQALLFVGSPGRHEVAWYLDRGSVQAYLGGCPTAFVEIRDQPGIQEIVVDLPREVEAAWLAKARELKRSRAHDEPSEGLWADFAAPVK